MFFMAAEKWFSPHDVRAVIQFSRRLQAAPDHPGEIIMLPESVVEEHMPKFDPRTVRRSRALGDIVALFYSVWEAYKCGGSLTFCADHSQRLDRSGQGGGSGEYQCNVLIRDTGESTLLALYQTVGGTAVESVEVSARLCWFAFLWLEIASSLMIGLLCRRSPFTPWTPPLS